MQTSAESELEFDSFLLFSLQSVSPRPASGPLSVCPGPLIPSPTPAITSCPHARLTGCPPAAWRDREIGTVPAACGGTTRGRGGAHAMKKEKKTRKTCWVEKLHCGCISGSFWVGLCVCNLLSGNVGLRFLAFPFHTLWFSQSPSESEDSWGSTAVQKARRFYQSCLDTKSIDAAGAEPFLALIQKVRVIKSLTF